MPDWSQIPRCEHHPWTLLSHTGFCPTCQTERDLDDYDRRRNHYKYAVYARTRKVDPYSLTEALGQTQKSPEQIMREEFPKGYQAAGWTVISSEPSFVVPMYSEDKKGQWKVRCRNEQGVTKWLTCAYLRREKKKHDQK